MTTNRWQNFARVGFRGQTKVVNLLLIVAILVSWSVSAWGAFELKLNNTYVAQENGRYCAPATIQMILNNQPNPNKDPMPTQDQLRDKIKANNSAWNHYNPGATYNSADADGVKGALNFYDNPPRNYLSYVRDTRDAANRKLAYNLNTYQVPAGALVNGGEHWINVRGFDSNVAPTVAGAYDINGFFIRDPWTGFAGVGTGIGKNRYLANNDGGWHQFFVPSKAEWVGTWDNKFVVVADPLETGDMDTVPDPSPSGPQMTSIQAAARAAIELSQIGELANESSFSGGAFCDSAGCGASLMTWYNQSSGQSDWVLPYYRFGSLSGAMILDSYTGDIHQALWAELGDNPSLESFMNEITLEYSGTFPRGQANVPEPGSVILVLWGLAIMMIGRRSGHRDPLK